MDAICLYLQHDSAGNAAEMRAQMRAQLEQQIQMYCGQGGHGGGSVYQHFPNPGAGGTGVGVTDLGGGDSTVNAGGVLCWPGK